MAQGDVVFFDSARLNMGRAALDLGASTSYTIRLVTALPSRSQTTADSQDFQQVGGTGAAQLPLSTTWTLDGSLCRFDVTTTPQWSQNPAGPENIVAGVIYSSSADSPPTTGDAVAFIDLTVDGGVTPISLRAGDIRITFATEGLFVFRAA